MSNTEYSPDRDELMALFKGKYGRRAKLGPGPELRLRYEYFTPDDHYEVWSSVCSSLARLGVTLVVGATSTMPAC